MHSITTALENLTRQLSQEIPATPGLCIFDAPFPLNDAFDALSWLASQSSFPQFYWQQRNGDEEAAVLGAITVFSSLDLAQRFLRQHAQPDLRIWGLNAFEPKEGYLLLPRLEWRRSGVRRPYAYICTVTFRYAMMRARRKRFSLLWSVLSLFRRCAFRSRANNTGRTKTVG